MHIRPVAIAAAVLVLFPCQAPSAVSPGKYVYDRELMARLLQVFCAGPHVKGSRSPTGGRG